MNRHVQLFTVFLVSLSVLAGCNCLRDFPCNPMQIMGCLWNVVMLPFTELGMQLTNVSGMVEPGTKIEITEPQFGDICKTLQNASICMATWVAPCVGPEVADAHTVFNTTARLLEVCDRPGIYAQTLPLLQCGLQIKEQVQEKCGNILGDRLGYMKGLKYEGMLPAIQSGRVMKDVCCVVKDMKECIDPLVQVCTTEARQLREQLINTIINAYGCSAKMASGCPASPNHPSA